MNNEHDEDTTNHPLPLSSSDTFIMNSKQTLRHMMHSGSADDVHPKREIILLIRGMSERLALMDDLSVVLGRADLKSGYRPDVDLTAYGAQNRGVSRSHARLHVQDEKFFVTDLNSPNGTFVNGQRLTANEPHMIRKGDNVMLGSLNIQVQF